MRASAAKVRGRQLASLTPLVFRATRWAASASGIALVGGLWIWRHLDGWGPSADLAAVRVTALLLALSVLPMLDDPASRQVAAVPLPWAWRQSMRLVPAGAFVLAPVAALARWLDLPVTGLLVEAATVFVATAGVSSLLTRRDHSVPSTAVTIATLPLPGFLLMLPPGAGLVVPEGSTWAAAHARWTYVLVVGAVALAVSLRDPTARSVGPARRIGRRMPSTPAR